MKELEEQLNKKLTPDDFFILHDVVDKAVRGAQVYNESSKESAIAIAELTTNQNNMTQEIQEIKNITKDTNTKLDALIISVTGMPETIFNKADERYISKKIAVAIISFTVLVGGTVIGLGIFSLKSMIKNEISETSVTKSEMKKNIEEIVVKTLEDNIVKVEYEN